MLAAISAEAASVILGLAGIAAGVLTTVFTLRAQSKQNDANNRHALDVLERQKESAEQQQLRNDLLAAAAALAGRLTAVDYRLANLSRDGAPSELDDIQSVLNDAGTELGRVAVLFGDRSETTTRAESAYNNLRLLLEWKRLLVRHEAVDERPVDPKESLAQIEQHAAFVSDDLRVFKRNAYATAAALTSAQPPGARATPSS